MYLISSRMFEIDDKTCQQITIPSTTHPFMKQLLLPMAPTSRELPFSEHLPEHHRAVPEATPPASDKTSKTIDLIDFHLQFSKHDTLNSWSQLRRQIIPRFECCNSPCSSADGYRWQQELLSIVKSIIRAVMKKSQRANLALMEIYNIHTFGYDVQYLYT